jgi:hypothetical protein
MVCWFDLSSLAEDQVCPELEEPRLPVKFRLPLMLRLLGLELLDSELLAGQTSVSF